MLNPPTLRTVLFADISGSVRLYEMVGDDVAVQIVGEALAMLRAACEEAGGTVVRTVGDAVLCVFTDPGAGLAAACAMQERSARSERPAAPNVRIRIGCHHGAVIEVSGDVYGDSVNTAARVAELSRAGQILATPILIEAAGEPWLKRTRSLGSLALKGKLEAIPVVEVLWDEAEEATALATRSMIQPEPCLTVRYRASTWQVCADGTAVLTLGREESCDIVAAGTRASRLHARIERRGGRFVLVDHSSNGTLVTNRHGDEVVLHREEHVLRGAGVICLGSSRADTEAERIEYRVD